MWAFVEQRETDHIKHQDEEHVLTRQRIVRRGGRKQQRKRQEGKPFPTEESTQTGAKSRGRHGLHTDVRSKERQRTERQQK